MIIRLLLIIPLLLFISCNRRVDPPDNTIIVNPVVAESFKLEDWISELELVPLETTANSVFNECYKLIEYDGKYYIQDQSQHALFVFSKDGKFLYNTLKLKGGGPGEYNSLLDFHIDTINGNILILDGYARQIRVFDKDLNFCSSIQLPDELLPLRNFVKFSNDIFIFYNINGTKKGSLIFYSVSNGKIIKRAEKLPSNASFLPTVVQSPFFTLNNQVFFNHIISSNSLYVIKENLELEKRFELDFGKFNFTLGMLPENKEDFATFFSAENENYASVFRKFENANYYFIHFLLKNRAYVVRYDKTNKSIQTKYSEFGKEEQLPPPTIVNNKYLIYLSEPSYINFIVSRDLMNKESLSVLNSIKDNDNPIIVKYRLK